MKYNIGVVKKMSRDPIYIDEDDKLIKTMIDVYRKNTGDKEAKPLVMGVELMLEH